MSCIEEIAPVVLGSSESLPDRAHSSIAMGAKLKDIIDVGSCAQRICVYADACLLAGEDLADCAFAQVAEVPAADNVGWASFVPRAVTLNATLVVSSDAAAILRTHALLSQEAASDTQPLGPIIAILVCTHGCAEEKLPALGELMDAGVEEVLCLSESSPLREPELQAALLKMDKRELQWKLAEEEWRNENTAAEARVREQCKWGLAGSVFLNIPPVDHNLVEKGNRIAGVNVSCRLGKGSFGTVYFGKNGSQAVALKYIQKRHLKTVDDLCSLDREIAILRLVRGGPNVTCLNSVTHGPLGIHLHLDYAGRHSLLAWLQNNAGRLVADEVLAVARQCAGALYHLHSLSVAHRDVKPENVVVADPLPATEPRITLVDMGLAVIAAEKSEESAQCGTVPFLAPEVREGVPYSAFAADAWSLGALFLELNYGAFAVDTVTGLTSKENVVEPWKLALLETRRPPLEPVSQALEGILSRLLVQRPERRARIGCLMQSFGARIPAAAPNALGAFFGQGRASFHNVCSRAGLSFRTRRSTPPTRGCESPEDSALRALARLPFSCAHDAGGLKRCVQTVANILLGAQSEGTPRRLAKLRAKHYFLDITDGDFDALLSACCETSSAPASRNLLEAYRPFILHGSRARRASFRLSSSGPAAHVQSSTVAAAVDALVNDGSRNCLRDVRCCFAEYVRGEVECPLLWQTPLVRHNVLEDVKGVVLDALGESSLNSNVLDYCHSATLMAVEDAHLRRCVMDTIPAPWSDQFSETLYRDAAAHAPLQWLTSRTGFVKCWRHLRALTDGTSTRDMSREFLQRAHGLVQEVHLDEFLAFLEDRKVGACLVASIRCLRPWIVGEAADSVALAMSEEHIGCTLSLRDQDTFVHRIATKVAHMLDLRKLDEAQLQYLCGPGITRPTRPEALVEPLTRLLGSSLPLFVAGVTSGDRMRLLASPLQGLTPSAETLDVISSSLQEIAEESKDPSSLLQRRLLYGRHVVFKETLFPRFCGDELYKKKSRSWTLPLLQEVIREAWAAAAAGTSISLRDKMTQRPNGAPSCLRMSAARVLIQTMRLRESGESTQDVARELEAAHTTCKLSLLDFSALLKLLHDASLRRELNSMQLLGAAHDMMPSLVVSDDVDVGLSFPLINTGCALLALARECRHAFTPDRCPVTMQRLVYETCSTDRVSLTIRQRLSPELLRSTHEPHNVTDQEFSTFLECLDSSLGFSPRTMSLREMRPYVVTRGAGAEPDRRHGYIVVSATMPGDVIGMSPGLLRGYGYAEDDLPLPMARLQGPLTDKAKVRRLSTAAVAGKVVTQAFVNYTRTGEELQLCMTTLPVTEEYCYFAIATFEAHVPRAPSTPKPSRSTRHGHAVRTCPVSGATADPSRCACPMARYIDAPPSEKAHESFKE